MDPSNSAQDLQRCDLCEAPIVHNYCDFCHVNLCKQCIVDHISDGYDKHKIVPFQQRKSTLIYPKCGTHPQKFCKFQCKNCENTFVCSSCVASEKHGGHRFLELSEIYKTKREAIREDTEKLRNIISTSYDEIALDLENQLANLDWGYEKITIEITRQGEEWRKEIDNVINKMNTEIKEIKVKHRYVLQKHLDEIRQTQSLITQTLHILRDIQKSTEVSPTIEYSSKISEFSKLPPKIQVSMPTFIPKPIDREKLYSFFGHITPLSTDTIENVLSPNQPNTLERGLMDEPEVVATNKTRRRYLRSISYLKDDKIWISGDNDYIHCFTMNGIILQTIKTKSIYSPGDIAVNSSGDLLLTEEAKRTVYEVKNGQTNELIRLRGWRPLNLCVTSTGDLLVTMYSDDKSESKVTRYSGSTEKQTIQFDDEGKPLYSGSANIKYITENRNHDICIADCWSGEVVVVNQDGKLRWRYTGNPSVTKNKPFVPRGITSDSQSHILTADYQNHCIHILDQNGQFLRYIDNCNLEDPFGLCVDNDDNLFVCEFNKGNVKKIKYLK